MDQRKQIIEQINKLAGRHSAYEVFSDWIQCMAFSISNGLTLIHDKVWKEREDAYIATMKRYTKEEQEAFYEMTARLVETMDEGPDDILGDIYMLSGMGSKAAGQFFTPFHVSELCAKLGINMDILNSNDLIEVNEPSCGGGGMIIAVAKTLYDAGINYQERMRVVAQDLDWKGVYMCYVQLSLLGINAVCVQGDTLQTPYDKNKTERSHILYTPAYMGVLFR